MEVIECSLFLTFSSTCPTRMIWLENKDGIIFLKNTICDNKYKLDFRTLNEDVYYLQIYINYYNDIFEGYLYGREIVIQKNKTSLHFLVCPIASINKYLVENRKLTLSPSPIEDCSADIQVLAKHITKKSKNKYEQIYLVHDWIAENLYYDYDLLKSSNINGTSTHRTVIEILRTRRCVCQGYNDLAIMLLTSLNIECEGILCFSLGADSEGTWTNRANRTADLNHVITRAHDGKRWVYMDITWDSFNKFENGVSFKSARPCPSHKYFDVTFELLSSTHRFFEKSK